MLKGGGGQNQSPWSPLSTIPYQSPREYALPDHDVDEVEERAARQQHQSRKRHPRQDRAWGAGSRGALLFEVEAVQHAVNERGEN